MSSFARKKKTYVWLAPDKMGFKKQWSNFLDTVTNEVHRELLDQSWSDDRALKDPRIQCSSDEESKKKLKISIIGAMSFLRNSLQTAPTLFGLVL